jgi:hypothetical protein
MFRSSGRCCDQGIMPSTITLISRSTEPARRWIPIISTVLAHRIIQLEASASVPLPVRPAVISCQCCNSSISPSVMTLPLRSTWNERSNCNQSVFVSPIPSWGVFVCTSQLHLRCPAIRRLGSPRIRWIATKWSESAWWRSIRRKRRQYRMKYSQ